MTEPSQNVQQPHRPDEEYKQATKEVVDDMLREDVLGPRICAILTNHTPASDKIKYIIADAITKEPTIKDAIETVLKEFDARRKSRWIDRGLGALGAIFLTVVGGLIVFMATDSLSKNTRSEFKSNTK